jgi:predicted GNAT superfamily acetyltransferase
MDVTIRSVATIAEYRAVEVLQRQAWAMPDDLEVVPLHLLVTVQRNGGLLLGAFDDEGLVGFVFGFPGLTAEGRAKHCSHMMAVAPAYQSLGVGYQLKLAQRTHVLAQGFDLITWTYDLLESRNAYLNLHKLGGVCRTYVRDYYGPMADGLNRGLPSDRFEVEWWIGEERVQRRLAHPPLTHRPLVDSLSPQGARKQSPLPWGRGGGRGKLPPAAHVPRKTPAGLLAPGPLTLDADAPYVQVEVPANYQAIKAADPGLALEWRLATREMFEAYFAAGYTAVDFVSQSVEDERRSSYLLCRG